MAESPAAPAAMPILLSNPAVPQRLGRVAGLLALACLIAHIPLIASHFAAAPIIGAAMVAVSMACVPCARRLWIAPTTQDCTIAAVLAATMVGLHLLLTISTTRSNTPAPSDMSTPGHHHTDMSAIADRTQTSTPMGEMHQMAMSPAIELIFYLATAMAILQVLLNVAAIATTIHRVKAVRQSPTTETEHLQVAITS